MWPADERDPRAVREKSEARAAAKAELVRVADVERALQRGAGRSGCSAERAMQRARSGAEEGAKQAAERARAGWAMRGGRGEKGERLLGRQQHAEARKRRKEKGKGLGRFQGLG